MPSFLVHQTHLIMNAANALEAQIKLQADTIIETKIERLNDGDMPSMPEVQPSSLSE